MVASRLLTWIEDVTKNLKISTLGTLLNDLERILRPFRRKNSSFEKFLSFWFENKVWLKRILEKVFFVRYGGSPGPFAFCARAFFWVHFWATLTILHQLQKP